MQAIYERRLIIQEIIENLLRALAELVMLAGENVGHLIREVRKYLEAQINDALKKIEKIEEILAGNMNGWEKYVYGEIYLSGGHKRVSTEMPRHLRAIARNIAAKLDEYLERAAKSFGVEKIELRFRTDVEEVIYGVLLRVAGKSYRAIAERVGRTHECVRKWCKNESLVAVIALG